MACLVSTRAPAQTSISPSNPEPGTRNPQPLFWADGITRTDQLNSYARLGLNTVVVRLFWQASTDGQIVATDLEPQLQFARAAAAQNLQIIYALPPYPLGDDGSLEIAGDSKPYRALWSAWTQNAMQQLQSTPNLRGWMLPDDPRGLPFQNNAGFARWLAANYANVGVLNSQWHATFKSLDEATLPAARRIVSSWRGDGPLMGSRSPSDMARYFSTAHKRAPGQNFAFHPVELALANYQWDAYRLLVDFWAQTARGFDPNPRHQIFSGRLPDYAQLLSLPPSVDVSVPSLMPGVAENDIATHNPQAIAIARRGGRFAAIPVLSTQLPDAPDNLVSRLLPSWCDAALAQGAKGLAFDSWPDIAQNPDLKRVLETTLLRLQTPTYAALWSQEPQASAAVVLTPLADGMTWHAPPNAPDAQNIPPRGMFGFGDDMVSGEPSDLVYALRWGTLFGNVDFLSPDELGGAYSVSRGGVLKPYGAVFLPQALNVSPAMASELASYVSNGGALVADVGLGATQNGGQIIGLSDTLAAMFGVAPVLMQTVGFDLKAITPHPLLPTWSAFVATNQNATAGDGPKNVAFAGPTLLTELAPGTVPLALGFQVPVPLPADPKTGASGRTRLLRSWLTLRPFGNGAAIFAPFRMWTFWRPGYPGFDAFHGDLLSRGAFVSELAATAFTPAPPGTPDGTAFYPAAVNFQNAIVLYNTNASGTPPYPNFNPPLRGSVADDAASTPIPRATPLPDANSMSGAITPAHYEQSASDKNASDKNFSGDEFFSPRDPSRFAEYSKARVQFVADADAKSKSKDKPEATFHRVSPSATPTPTPDAPDSAPAPPDSQPNIPQSDNSHGDNSHTNNSHTNNSHTRAPQPSTPPANNPSAWKIVPRPNAPIQPLPSLPAIPSLGSDGNSGNFNAGNFNAAIVPVTPPLPAVVQTTGVDQFLWSDAICVFPVGASPPATPGRRPPVEYSTGANAGDSSFVVPAATHPVILHAFVPAQEMKVLRLLPVRALNTGGGPLTVRARIYTPQKIELRAWPNAQVATPGPNEWRVISGQEGVVRFSVFDRDELGDYRVLPGSKHVVSVTEISTDGKNKVAATRNYVLSADAQGTLSFELKGTALGISITPFAQPSTPTNGDAPSNAPEVLAITPDPNDTSARDTTLPAGTPVPIPAPVPRPMPTAPAPKPKPKADVRLPHSGASTPTGDDDDQNPSGQIGSDGAPVFHKRYGR